MTITRYRKKPVEVDTIQWTGDNEAELIAFTSNNFHALDDADRENSDDPEATAEVYDKLHSTWILVYTGQHIVRGVKGEYYPIAEDVLAETYERVGDGSTASENTVPRALFEENARRHKGAIARVDELHAVVGRVRALHQPQPDGTGFDDGQQCRTCSRDGGDGYQYLVPWPCPTVRTLDEPAPAATEATELETTARVFAGLHRSAEDTITRVITLHEQWVKAGPPPLGAPLTRWWDARLAELHNAIQPTDHTKEK
ncbi:hypothetical protein RKD37_001734 [Streptomyces ambofaciens]